METFSPSQNFQTMYSPLGIYRGAIPFSFQTALPAGMVPNLNLPSNAKEQQTGTPYTSEINMQNGVIYAGVKTFPRNITEALESTVPGYRIGLDIKDRNTPKLYFGSNNQFLFWDGTNLSMSGQLSVYGEDNAIKFYDLSQNLQGEIFANNTGMIVQSIHELLILIGTVGRIISAGIFEIDVGGVQQLVFDPDPAGPNVGARVPFGLCQLAADPALGINGQMYYNTTTDNIMAFVAGAWVIVV